AVSGRQCNTLGVEGVVAKRIAWETRAAGYTGLLAGGSSEDVAAQLGVAHATVGRWARLAGMTFLPSRSGGGIEQVRITDPPPDAERAYRRLTLADRTLIEMARSVPEPWSIRRIAEHLGVAPSTVSREIRRHALADGLGRHRSGRKRRYHAGVAHHRAVTLRHRARQRKLDDPALREQVVSGLNNRWSPQEVAGWLQLTFPDRPEMHVSHETIYQALYVQGKGTLRAELAVVKALRSGRTNRIPQSKLPRRSSRPWLEGALLVDRPAEASDRAVPGHWEGDLVVGPHNSGIVTLVERQTRYALIGRLPGMRDSATVIDVLRNMIEQLPAGLLRTITWDQGIEMAQHATFTVKTGCPVFFCDPHSPWQRGTNENTNGLIRDFYPKGTDFNEIDDTDLANTQRLLNGRPRQTLGFHTPAEKLDELVSVALAS
ncbi:IS30 family transposase, partial [Microbacterium sp. SYP-A9085]|uniref:IS30 family transposase n=1 Tax=Microbacterium sp. SYP-A9085 TaxID=2664454 RepID=UPI0020A69F99